MQFLAAPVTLNICLCPMSDKAFFPWVLGLFATFVWFGAWGGLLQPLLPGNSFDSLAALKLIAGLVALGVAVIMDQLECIKDVLRGEGRRT